MSHLFCTFIISEMKQLSFILNSFLFGIHPIFMFLSLFFLYKRFTKKSSPKSKEVAFVLVQCHFLFHPLIVVIFRQDSKILFLSLIKFSLVFFYCSCYDYSYWCWLLLHYCQHKKSCPTKQHYHYIQFHEAEIIIPDRMIPN